MWRRVVLACAVLAGTLVGVAADGLEVILWASSPMLFNPTNIDIGAHP